MVAAPVSAATPSAQSRQRSASARSRSGGSARKRWKGPGAVLRRADPGRPHAGVVEAGRRELRPALGQRVLDRGGAGLAHADVEGEPHRAPLRLGSLRKTDRSP